VSVTWSCSAFGNFSIVLLLFVTLARSVRPKAQRSEMLLLAALFGSTFLINSIRLLLETTNRGYYVALHSDSGGALFNFLTVATATALSLYWFRRDIHAYG